MKILIALSAGMLLCGQIFTPRPAAPPSQQSTTRCHVDTNRVAVVPFAPYLVLDVDARPASQPVELEDIERSECLLLTRVDQWNDDHGADQAARVVEPEHYYRQYCALQDEHGHRLIYLNAFCGDWHLDRWKHFWVQVEDGGNCYFHALFDLTTQRALMFSVNGRA